MEKQNKNAGSRVSSFATFLGSLLVLAVMGFVIYVLMFSDKEKTSANIAPDYVVDRMDIYNMQALPAPSEYLNDSAKGMVISSQYLVFPEKKVGEQNVAILLRLEDGTSRTENAVLSVHDATVTWELGTDATPQSLLGDEFAGAEFVKPLSDYAKVGTYENVKISKDGKELPFKLIVQDTTPPAVTVKDSASFSLNQIIKTEDVLPVIEYTDATKVSFLLDDIPDTHENCEGTLKLIATDDCGNSTTVDVKYGVFGDCTPPVISGLKTMKTIRYVNIDMMHDVTAVDETDGPVPVEIKMPADFNIKKEGDYTVTYIAKDACGNTAQETAVVKIINNDNIDTLTEEDVLRMGYYINNTLLAVKDGEEPLTEKQKARKIYFQVQNHIKFKDNNDNLPWHINAALVLQRGYGDCRNYCGYAKMLYTCAGFENMIVEHIPESPTAAKHFWNLVKIDGEWWHCDSTPRIKEQIFFMWTDAQMDAYSKTDGNCFERDRSLYPKTP